MQQDDRAPWLRLLQAINNVRYVRSFNALKVKEVAVACSAVESVCGRVVLEILADHGGNLMHNCNKGRDGLCVRVVLLCNILGSRSDGCVDCDVQKTLGDRCRMALRPLSQQLLLNYMSRLLDIRNGRWSFGIFGSCKCKSCAAYDLVECTFFFVSSAFAGSSPSVT